MTELLVVLSLVAFGLFSRFIYKDITGKNEEQHQSDDYYIRKDW